MFQYAQVDICYTTDGKEPTAQSHAYKGPFPLKKSATIKAAVFQHGKLAGKVSVLSYMVHKASGKPYTLSKEPGNTGVLNLMASRMDSWALQKPGTNG
ncbi:MAG: FN3 associated domain-containing protein [Saprospiraceae bacterium]